MPFHTISANLLSVGLKAIYTYIGGTGMSLKPKCLFPEGMIEISSANMQNFRRWRVYQIPHPAQRIHEWRPRILVSQNFLSNSCDGKKKRFQKLTQFSPVAYRPKREAPTGRTPRRWWCAEWSVQPQRSRHTARGSQTAGGRPWRARSLPRPPRTPGVFPWVVKWTYNLDFTQIAFRNGNVQRYMEGVPQTQPHLNTRSCFQNGALFSPTMGGPQGVRLKVCSHQRRTGIRLELTWILVHFNENFVSIRDECQYLVRICRQIKPKASVWKQCKCAEVQEKQLNCAQDFEGRFTLMPPGFAQAMNPIQDKSQDFRPRTGCLVWECSVPLLAPVVTSITSSTKEKGFWSRRVCFHRSFIKVHRPRSLLWQRCHVYPLTANRKQLPHSCGRPLRPKSIKKQKLYLPKNFWDCKIQSL